jgi:hypothetical protein
MAIILALGTLESVCILATLICNITSSICLLLHGISLACVHYLFSTGLIEEYNNGANKSTSKCDKSFDTHYCLFIEHVGPAKFD